MVRLVMKNSAILVLCGLLATSCLHASERPKILIFLVDDMGLMDTSVPFLSGGKSQPKSHPGDLRRMVKAMAAALEDADAQYPVAKDDPKTELKPIVP